MYASNCIPVSNNEPRSPRCRRCSEGDGNDRKDGGLSTLITAFFFS